MATNGAGVGVAFGNTDATTGGSLGGHKILAFHGGREGRTGSSGCSNNFTEINRLSTGYKQV
jgi:hypothetical protein